MAVQVFDRIADDDYEQVVYCHDRATGLRAVIAVHSTRLGPALGGTRFHPYASEDDAVEDVLRLARGMTYKSASMTSAASASCADRPPLRFGHRFSAPRRETVPKRGGGRSQDS